MYRILIVEDAKEISEALEKILREERYVTQIADTQEKAVALLEGSEEPFDLALVDLTLPDGGHGFAVYRVAESRHVPTIFLTATDDEYMHAQGIEMGAYDYICKPYSKPVLLARIRSALTRSGKMNAELVCRDLRIDLSRGKAYKNGQELYLSRIEYNILLLFMNNLGHIISRDRLMYEICDFADSYITDNTLTKHINRLRDKIEDDPQEPTHICTVRGMGYKMEK